MYQRYFIFLLAVFALSGLVRWSDPSDLSHFAAEPSRAPASDNTLLQQELVETMDQLVIAQRAYKTTHGYYTRLLGKLAFASSASVNENFAINIEEATPSTLKISAYSEDQGRTKHFLMINQDFQVRANFTLPPPRIEYLKKLALNHLELIKETGKAEPLSNTHFKGYFSFEINRDNVNSTVLAHGIQHPVKELLLETNYDLPETQQTGNLLTEMIQKFPKIRGIKTGELDKLEIEPVRAEFLK